MSLLEKASGKKLRMKSAKLRILHVGNHTTPCVGGIENVIWQSAREQAKQGHTVQALVFDVCTNGKKLPSFEEKEGVQIFRIPQGGLHFYRIPAEKELRARGKDQDIIHIHGVGSWSDGFERIKKDLSAKIVLNTHGGFFHTNKRGLLKQIYARFFLPSAWEKMDGIIYDSQSDLEKFSFLPPKEHRIIPDGIENELLDIPLTQKKKDHFLFVGRLSKNKRVDRLIDTFALFVRKNPKATLNIVGEDWEGVGNELKERAKEKGMSDQIIFHGKVSHEKRHELFTECAFFVSASEYEGFGISTIEGMAAGCIPCVSDIPTFREFIGTERGFIVDYENPEKAAEVWEKATGMTAVNQKALQKSIREYARAFAWSTISARCVEWYRFLLSQKKNPY